MAQTTVKTNQEIKSIRPLTDEEVTRFHKDGFIIIRNMFSAQELKPLQEALKKDPTMGNSQTAVIYEDGKSWKVSAWTDLGETFLGIMPRTARIVDAIELLLEEECYHWHSKIVIKQPGDGKVDWHADFSAWYQDGCLYPNMITCSIALDKNDISNGCLQILRGSHVMARLDDVTRGNSVAGDPVRMEKAFENHELVYCEMDAGDVLFFHAKTLHGSDDNNSHEVRSLIHSTFNARSNEPIFRERQQHHLYKPLTKLPDSALKDANCSAFDDQIFHGKETDGNKRKGIFLRRLPHKE
ncbi:MAG: phytanoyl-CoA dioxygenase family protein [Okeania sp. SIO1H6]|nr:phytanoyl-CoA dioxygenase family protein [Okeania sp. SIO1H6]